MSLENILKKIVQEAEEEAARLRREAQERTEQIVSSGRQEAERKAAALIQRAEEEANLEAQSLLSQARLEKRLALLQAKRKWVDLVLDKVFEEAGLIGRAVSRTIVTRQGVEQEQIEANRLKEDLRLRWEKKILEILGI